MSLLNLFIQNLIFIMARFQIPAIYCSITVSRYLILDRSNIDMVENFQYRPALLGCYVDKYIYQILHLPFMQKH